LEVVGTKELMQGVWECSSMTLPTKSVIFKLAPLIDIVNVQGEAIDGQ
jgi:hypothetical protein